MDVHKGASVQYITSINKLRQFFNNTNNVLIL